MGVWDYTPRQIAGFHDFAGRRLRQEAAQQLSLTAMATRGDPQKLKKEIGDLQK